MRKMLIIVGAIAGVIIVLFIGFSIYLRIATKKELQESKPYITYTRLIGVAADCDKYKEKYGEWPTNLTQLIAFRPELTDWAKDAWGKGDDLWGRYVVLVPYDKSVGYGEVISYGRDGKPGGTDLDAELVVRFPSEANAAWNKQQGEGLKKPQRAP